MRTLGSPVLALLAQAQALGVPEASGVTFVGLLGESTAVTLGVLGILGFLSVASWSIILFKIWIFGRSERQTRRFLEVFRRSSKFSEVQAVCSSLAASPLVGLFQSGYAELTAQLRQPSGDAEASVTNTRTAAGRPTLKSLNAVDRALMRAAAVEVTKLERRIPFLATTASVSPFVGLFGTVWGIMAAFLNISQLGSTNLSVVAPGIAEALVATAAGLAAAIPAVVAYNHLSNRVKLFAAEMDDFSMEFLNIAERNFT